MARMFEGLFTEEGMKTITPSLDLGDIESTVKGYTDKYDVDNDLVSALIQQESGGNPNAISGVGATGLMQIMPETAREIAEELGEVYTSSKLKDPETNIRWGTYHLKSLLDKFGGDELKALAAYHAGAGAVSKAEKQGKRVPDTYDPTAEISTKDYVKQVMGKKGQEISYGEMGSGRMFAGLFKDVEFPERKEISSEIRLAKKPEGKTIEEVTKEQFGEPSFEEKVVGGIINKFIPKPEPSPAETTRVSSTFKEEKGKPSKIAQFGKETVAYTRGLGAATAEAVTGVPAILGKTVSGITSFVDDFIQSGGDTQFAAEGFMQGFRGERDILGESGEAWTQLGEKLGETIRGKPKTEGEKYQQYLANTTLDAYFILQGGAGLLKSLPKTNKFITTTAQGIVNKAKLSSKTLKTLKLSDTELLNVKNAIRGTEGITAKNLTPRERAFYNHVMIDTERLAGKAIKAKEIRDIVYPWEQPAWGKVAKKGKRPVAGALPAPAKTPTTVDDMVENLLAEGGVYTPEMIRKGKVPKSELVKPTEKFTGFKEKPIGKAVAGKERTTAFDPVTQKEYPIKVLKDAKDVALEKIGGNLTKANETQYDKALIVELRKYKPTKEIKIEKITPEEELKKRVREAKPPPKEKEFEHFRKIIEKEKAPTTEMGNISEELGAKKPFKETDKPIGEGGFVRIPDKKEIKEGIAQVSSLISTESPYKLVGAPETGRAVKLLNSRLSVADEKALDFVKKGAADIQPNKVKVTVERPIKGVKLKGAKRTKTVGAKEEVDIDLSEDAIVFFSTANPKHLDKISPGQRNRLKKVVDTFNKMNEKYETELRDMGVLERGWPESAIKRNKERIETLKKEMVSKKKRPVKKIVDEINQLTEDNKALSEMKYMHFPARIWLADKYDNDPDAFRAILSGSFKGIKGRKTVDPFDLVEAGVLDPSKVSAKEAMAVYMRYVDHQKAQVAIRDMAIMEKVAMKPDEAPFDYIDMGAKYPLFEGYKVHPIVAEQLTNTFDLIGARQGTVEKIMSVTKMLQFYNPVIMPMYDTFQAAAVTQGRFLRPKHIKKAVTDVIKKTPDYYEAADNGLYSKPFKNTFSNFKNELERIKESQTIKDMIKFEFGRLKENPARALADIYSASWNTAWFGDKILRMASYNVLRNQGLSPRDAAKFAAEAHADYAGVPTKTRKTLNKVLFTPTFQISMLKWHTKMFLSALRTPASTVGRITGKKIGETVGKDWIRAASFASAMGMLMAMDYGLRKGLGWKREEFGRKYKKDVKYIDEKGKEQEKQVVVTLSNPINVPLKYYYTFVKPKPGMTKSEQIAKYGKYWLHPLLKLGLELSNNKRPNGDPIANPWTSPSRKLIDTSRYVAANIFSMYRGLIDEPENTKREALETLRKAGDNPFNQILRPIAFLYTRQAQDKRIATRAQRVLTDFNRDLVDRPPRTKKELETMYNNLLKVFDGLEKEAVNFETKKIVLQSRGKAMRDSLVLRFFYKKGKLTGEEIKEIRKGMRK